MAAAANRQKSDLSSSNAIVAMWKLSPCLSFSCAPEDQGHAPYFWPNLPAVVSSVSEAQQLLAALVFYSLVPRWNGCQASAFVQDTYLTGGFKYHTVLVNNYASQYTLHASSRCSSRPQNHHLPFASRLRRLTLWELMRCKVDSTSDCAGQNRGLAWS